ncbi:opsin-3 [Pseudophryne corroboree]|uniref:opsin-3 n=1 Tax=Pseudophryne corroboree TaxID=495146 RepID=UPI0030815DD8
MSYVTRNGSKVHSGTHNEEIFTRDGYKVLALTTALLGLLGFCNNLLVLILYCRFRTLRTPLNLLLVNISFSDLILSLFDVTFTFASCVSQQWIWGEAGCVFAGFCKTLLGSVSVFTLTVVAYERYVRVVYDKVIDYIWSGQAIMCVWLYSLAWTAAPLLGWNKYILELHGLDCSLDWISKNPKESSFILLFFLTGKVIPVGIMTYCYGYILYSIRMIRNIHMLQTSHILKILHYEIKVSQMCFLMMLAFLICWMPYPVVSLLAMCGYGNMITPTVAIVPSFLSIFSTATNPVIYIISKKFRQGFLKLFCLKCLRIQAMAVNLRKKTAGKMRKGGNRRKQRVTFSSSSLSAIMTTGETGTQQSIKNTESIHRTNVKIIYVQPL